MMIVSDKKVNKESEIQITYDEFFKMATSDDGLDVPDILAINVNDISDQEIFEEIASAYENTIFFTLNGVIPSYAKKVKVEDWSKFYKKESNDFDDIEESIVNLLEEAVHDETEEYYQTNDKDENKMARLIVFGSSKGGTGKTFTSIMSTYRYAKTHPSERIALVDFDIIDGQVGISIHKARPTMANYYVEYQKGYKDFKTMKNFAVKGNKVFPKNVDFYLAPSYGATIENDDFWLNIIQNCMENYDVVVFDTGIDYLNLTPISYAYKIADKINLITTTSLKSTTSITKQIDRLTGAIRSPGKINGKVVPNVYSKDDEIGPRLNVIITQMVDVAERENTMVYNSLSKKCNVIATFGVITDSVARAEYYGEWDIFDKNKAINNYFDLIMS